MGILSAGSLDRRVRIERPVADNSLDGAGSGAWEPVATVWAEVYDMQPSRGERLAEGVNVATRPARVRVRYRDDISSEMRVVALKADGTVARVMQITTQPAELGRREGLEFMVEDYTSAGNTA